MKLEIKLQLLMFASAQQTLCVKHANDADRTEFAKAMNDLIEKTVNQIEELFHECTANRS